MKKAIISIIVLVILGVMVSASTRLTPSTTYSGTATVAINTFGIGADTFEVIFDTPIPDYQVTLQGFSTEIDMIWEADMSAGYGAGMLEKDCYIVEKKTTGFRGLCNYRLYQVSMVYYFKGEYVNYWSLKNDYILEGIGDTAFDVDWILTTKPITNVGR